MQQVIILRRGEIGPRVIKTVYTKDEQVGYIIRNRQRVRVERVGWVDERKLTQLWTV